MANSEKKNDLIKVRGVLTGCMYGATQFDKDDKLHVSIKFGDGERVKLIEEVDARHAYDKTQDGFMPTWYKDEKSEYINFKSKFDIKAVYNKDGAKCNSTLKEMLGELGSLTGSDVIAAVNIKDGAVYLAAIAFTTLKVTNAADFFDDDELPFA